MTISLKCFIRRLLRRISSCQRANISGDMAGMSGVIVNSSSFIRSSLGGTSPIQSLWYAALTLCVKKLTAASIHGKRRPPDSEATLRLEQAPQLHGQAHVPLELELAGHESHLAIELAPDHVEPVAGRHGHGEVRGGGGARVHRAGAVLDDSVPRAPAVAADVVLDGPVDASGIAALNLVGIRSKVSLTVGMVAPLRWSRR